MADQNGSDENEVVLEISADDLASAELIGPKIATLARLRADIAAADYERGVVHLRYHNGAEMTLDLGDVLTGDFGRSISTGQNVVEDIRRVFPATVELATLGTLIGVLIGVPLGVIAAARPGIESGRLAELRLSPPLAAGARFAYVTLAGRTEAPVMQVLRRFVAERLRD